MSMSLMAFKRNILQPSGLKSLAFIGLSLVCLNGNAAQFSSIGKSTIVASNGYSQQVHHPRYNNLPAYLVEMNNGKLSPAKLVVPAKQRFRIIIRNTGSKPAEFESNQLRQEKILYMGTESVVVVSPLSSGTYDYYDDFTPGVKGLIVAK